MSSRVVELSLRALRRLGPAVLLAVAPKCPLCALAGAGLGAALGLGGPEICGASAGMSGGWAISVGGLGVAGALGLAGLCAQRRRMPVPHGRGESRFQDRPQL